MTVKRLAAIVEAVEEYSNTHDAIAASLTVKGRYADVFLHTAKVRHARAGLRVLLARFPQQASQLNGSNQ